MLGVDWIAYVFRLFSLLHRKKLFTFNVWKRNIGTFVWKTRYGRLDVPLSVIIILICELISFVRCRRGGVHGRDPQLPPAAAHVGGTRRVRRQQHALPAPAHRLRRRACATPGTEMLEQRHLAHATWDRLLVKPLTDKISIMFGNFLFNRQLVPVCVIRGR